MQIQDSNYSKISMHLSTFHSSTFTFCRNKIYLFSLLLFLGLEFLITTKEVISMCLTHTFVNNVIIDDTAKCSVITRYKIHAYFLHFSALQRVHILFLLSLMILTRDLF